MITCFGCRQDLENPLTTFEGKLYHPGCAQKARERPGTVPFAQGWVVRWEEDEYGPMHKLPCPCPYHRELAQVDEIPEHEGAEWE